MFRPSRSGNSTQGRRARLLLIALVGLAGLAAVAILWIRQGAAGILEGFALKSAEEHAVRVEQFSIDRVGFGSMETGPMLAYYQGMRITADGLVVGYSPRLLLRQRVESIDLHGPQVQIRMPLPLPMLREGADPAVPTEPLEGLVADASGHAVVDPVNEGTGAVADGATVAGPDSAAPDEPFDLFATLQDLPFSRATAKDGGLALAIELGTLYPLDLNLGWDLQLYNLGGGQQALLRAAGEALTTEFAAELATEGTDEWVVNADLELQTWLFNEVWNRAVELQLVPVEVSPEWAQPLRLNMLAEGNGETLRNASVQVEWDRVGIGHPALDRAVSLESMIGVARVHGTEWEVDGGLRVRDLNLSGWSFSPFAVTANLTSADVAGFETESIQAGSSSGEAEFGLRGSWLGGSAKPRVELAISSAYFEGVSLDAASILVELEQPLAQRSLTFQSSELGLTRNGSIWIDGLKGRAALTGEGMEVAATASWFDDLGRRMGEFGLGLVESGLQRDWRVDWSSSDGNFGEITARQSGSGWRRLSGRGRLPADWVGTLSKWWIGKGVDYSGAGPDISVLLDRTGLIPRGHIRAHVEDAGLELPSGTRLSGIVAGVNIGVMGLPRSNGSQKVRIDRVVAGGVAISDVALDWELPGIHRLQVTRLDAQLDPDARISVDPFEFNPLAINAQLTARLQNLDSRRILELLKEERFDMDARLEGDLRATYDGEQVVLRAAKLQMSGASGRFTFKDPEFLREQFRSVGEMPLNLKERLLQALLQRGIELSELRVELRQGSRAGTILVVMRIGGITQSSDLSIPIGGLVINHVISESELLQLQIGRAHV